MEKNCILVVRCQKPWGETCIEPNTCTLGGRKTWT